MPSLYQLSLKMSLFPKAIAQNGVRWLNASKIFLMGTIITKFEKKQQLFQLIFDHTMKKTANFSFLIDRYIYVTGIVPGGGM